MQLREAIEAAGMIPPADLTPGRWLRFPGIGKRRGNRSGWCRVISPTLAIFGDWSSNLSAFWRDESHRDDEASRRAFDLARKREREFQLTQLQRQRAVAAEARRLVTRAKLARHPYLTRKGLADEMGLVHEGRLIIPMRDARAYSDIINAQLIEEDGTKRFLTGGRAGGAILILGPPHARHTVLCEGWATGRSLQIALDLLPGPSRVVVCFSATNLQKVATDFPNALVAADNDRSGTGERTAIATGLRWTMPQEIGTDFNDLHQSRGIYPVVEHLRKMLA